MGILKLQTICVLGLSTFPKSRLYVLREAKINVLNARIFVKSAFVSFKSRKICSSKCVIKKFPFFKKNQEFQVVIGELFCPKFRKEKCVCISTNQNFQNSFCDTKKYKTSRYEPEFLFKGQKPTVTLILGHDIDYFPKRTSRDYEAKKNATKKSQPITASYSQTWTKKTEIITFTALSCQSPIGWYN